MCGFHMNSQNYNWSEHLGILRAFDPTSYKYPVSCNSSSIHMLLLMLFAAVLRQLGYDLFFQ